LRFSVICNNFEIGCKDTHFFSNAQKKEQQKVFFFTEGLATGKQERRLRGNICAHSPCIRLQIIPQNQAVETTRQKKKYFFEKRFVYIKKM
jgi:hypothetical protein